MKRILLGVLSILLAATFFLIPAKIVLADYMESQTQYNTYEKLVWDAHCLRIGQRLTISNRYVTGLSFALSKMGTPSGNISFAIWDLDNNVLVSKLWGSAVDLSTNAEFKTVMFDEPVYVNEEVRILVVGSEYIGPNASNCACVHYLYNSDVKSSENYTYYSGSFAELSSSECAYVYYHTEVSLPSPVITTGDAFLSSLQLQLTSYDYLVPCSINTTGITCNITVGTLVGTSNTTLTQNNLYSFVYTANFSQIQMFIQNIRSLLPNTTYYYQAYAYYIPDLYHYMVGYGEIKSLTTPSANITAQGAVSLTQASISGTTAGLTGSIDRIGNVPFPFRGFAWNTTNDTASSIQWSEFAAPINNIGWNMGSYYHQIDGLQTDTFYYFWAFIKTSTNEYIWSNSQGIETEATSNVTLMIPLVVTNLPSSVTANSVNASLSIISTVAGYPPDWSEIIKVSSYGFDVGRQSGSYTDFLRHPGVFGHGDYWLMLSSPTWEDGSVIYLRAFAHNMYGDAYGKEIAVKLSASGVIIPLPIPLGISDFTALIRAHMASLGMDNPTGHWAYMLMIQLIVGLPMIVLLIFLFTKDEKMICKIVAVIWLLVVLVIFGGFMFSGLLGMWSVLILIAGVVGLVIFLLGRTVMGGGQTSG